MAEQVRASLLTVGVKLPRKASLVPSFMRRCMHVSLAGDGRASRRNNGSRAERPPMILMTLAMGARE